MKSLRRQTIHPLVYLLGFGRRKALKFLRLTQELNAGVVWANTYNKFDSTSPFGGYKESGFGREGGATWFNLLSKC